MADPKGTTIEDLRRHLGITRRSVFRTLNTIEKVLNISIVVKRKVFGGTASYYLPPSFINKLSTINFPPLSLNFNQALVAYLILKDSTFVQDDALSGEYNKLRDTLLTLYKL
jgi:hypothetical protein